VSRADRFEQTVVSLGLAVVLVFLVKAVAPDAGVFAWLGATGLLRLGALAKLACLAVAVVFAARSASRLERDNPARSPWLGLAVGLAAFLGGQLVLGFYQMVLGIATPFPSPADVFFGLGYPLLFAALVGFVRVYRASGYPIGSGAEQATVAVGAVVGFALLGYLALTPILTSSAPLLERVLNAGYPVLDLVLMVPTLMLLRMAWRFAGGQVADVWSAVLMGFVAMAAADVAYAWFSTLKIERLDPVVDALFLLSYLSLARGTMRQFRLLAG
jgi:hypothetical protein